MLLWISFNSYMQTTPVELRSQHNDPSCAQIKRFLSRSPYALEHRRGLNHSSLNVVFSSLYSTGHAPLFSQIHIVPMRGPSYLHRFMKEVEAFSM